jgi:hypothetical protein
MRAFSAGIVLSMGWFLVPAVAQQPARCPGGRVITGFQLWVSPAHGRGQVPLAAINRIQAGDVLRYVPDDLPPAWRRSAKVAVIAVPEANDASAQLGVFSAPARKPAAWRMPTAIGALAFLFGPNGLNPGKTRSLLTRHPELVAHFTAYAEQATRVEALVALLSKYEASPPGSLNLDAMLKRYSNRYGVTMPKADPALPPNQEAQVMLAAVAPPTAQEGPPAHAALAAGGTSTATALATLYFAPVMGIATDSLPLFRALHQTLFPGTEFQGAFAQSGTNASRLCGANTAAPPGKHTVYIWMSDLPGGEAPVVRLAQGANAVVAAGTQATLHVTCSTVGGLRDLARDRAWRLLAAGHATPVPVTVNSGAVQDTLTLDLRHVSVPPGDYHLASLWDWTPVDVQGTITVKPVAPLSGAKLAPGIADRLIAGAGPVPIALQGADFTFLTRLALRRPGAAPLALPFTLASGGARLTATLDTAKLAPGAYSLALAQSGGAQRTIPLTLLPPNPVLTPLRANIGAGAEKVTLRGQHLERIARIVAPGATFTLAPVAGVPPGGLTRRPATVELGPHAVPGQALTAALYVTGLSRPLSLPDAVAVLGPRPVIRGLSQSVDAGGTVALLPGELPSDATVNFAFHLLHAPAQPVFDLRCRRPADQQPDIMGPVALRPGQADGSQELESGGDGLFYLAAVPGRIGAPGCELEMSVADPSTGASAPVPLGRVVVLPSILSFTLSNSSPAPGEFAGQLTGNNLQLIAATGWNPSRGVPVRAIPLRVANSTPGQASRQTLSIAMPWPPPEPHAPLYIWLHGEPQGRKTTVRP